MRAFIFFTIFSTFVSLFGEQTNFQNEKKYALVTGASRGIGRSLIEALIEKDKNLQIFAVARGKKDLEQLSRLYPNNLLPIIADISRLEGLEKIQETVRSYLVNGGTLSYLVHNAAIIYPLGNLDYLAQQTSSSMLSIMDKSYNTNVIAPHLLTIALLSELKKATNARVLFISSPAAEIAAPGAVTYSCTKAALDHLVLNLKSSLKKEVFFGVLNPGEVDTDMQAELRALSENQLPISSQYREAKNNHQLLSPKVAAQFIVHLLYDVSLEEFSEKKWDIYFIRPKSLPDYLINAIGIPPKYVIPNEKGN
jgi:benzil reductase ((S)-benzoin forming)